MSPRPFMPVTQGPRNRPIQRPCSKFTLRCAIAKDYRCLTPPCCRQWQTEIMRTMAELYRKAGVTWWLDYGSLLGAVRNPLTTWADYAFLAGEKDAAGRIPPGILPHDKDGDCGVLGSDREKVLALQRDVVRAGLDWLHRPPRPGGEFAAGDSLKVRWSRLNWSNVDYFFWYERKEADGAVTMYRERYIQADRFKGREFPRDKLFPLTTIRWEGMDLPAPNDPEWFCQHRYGPGWRTPIAANHDKVAR